MRRDYPITGGGCKARIQNKWFHERQFPGTTDHPCPFKPRRDGYCFRHHPSDRRRTLECRKVKLEAALAKVNTELAAIEPADGPGNPS